MPSWKIAATVSGRMTAEQLDCVISRLRKESGRDAGHMQDRRDPDAVQPEASGYPTDTGVILTWSIGALDTYNARERAVRILREAQQKCGVTGAVQNIHLR
jgi:hypothetical protein